MKLKRFIEVLDRRLQESCIEDEVDMVWRLAVETYIEVEGEAEG